MPRWADEAAPPQPSQWIFSRRVDDRPRDTSYHLRRRVRTPVHLDEKVSLRFAALELFPGSAFRLGSNSPRHQRLWLPAKERVSRKCDASALDLCSYAVRVERYDLPDFALHHWNDLHHAKQV